MTLSYFSLITTVGTPQSVTAEELRLECMIPADDETERRHENQLRMVSSSSRRASDFVSRHAR